MSEKMVGQGGGKERERVTQRFTVTIGDCQRMEIEMRLWVDLSVPGDVLPDWRTLEKPNLREMERAVSQLRRFLTAQIEAGYQEVRGEERSRV